MSFGVTYEDGRQLPSGYFLAQWILYLLSQSSLSIIRGNNIIFVVEESLESGDLSKDTHYVSCSETKTRYNVSRICGHTTTWPCQNRWEVIFKRKIIFDRLSIGLNWLVGALSLNTRSLDLEPKYPRCTHPVFFLSQSYLLWEALFTEADMKEMASENLYFHQTYCFLPFR